jgi:hypothetical protein
MRQSDIQPYLDVLMQHLSDLMVEAGAWPEEAQTHLYAFWSHLDSLTLLLPQPHLPLRETRFYIGELWQELAALKQMGFAGDAFWRLEELDKTLVYVSHLVDEQLCSSFELPVIAINTMDTVDWTPVK